MKYDFEGEHAYVLVQTKNLPSNLPDIYIESVNTCAVHDDGDSQHDDSSSEEDHSRKVRDDSEEDDDSRDSDDDSEEEGNYKLKALKIRVYNHTVELKKKRRLVVSTKGI